MPETGCLIESPCPLERPWNRVHVHAPRGDGSFVSAPQLSEAVEVAHRNRDSLMGASADIQGKSLAQIREWARRDLYQAASKYTAQLLSEGAVRPDGKHNSRDDGESAAGGGTFRETLDPVEAAFFVSGHQPTLFHPGVWVKNFVVGRLAKNDRAIGLNLIVDNDKNSTTAIRVPTGPLETPGLMTVPFDEPRGSEPWEEARIVNRQLFATFAERVERAMRDLGFSPLVADFWPAAVRHSAKSDSLAECLTAARCAWERSWDVANLELPISRLCVLEPFLWFASHILAHLPRFHGVYNEVLREYRQVNRVRSRTHPVPDLREAEGWLEAPFRVWRAGECERKRVFARQFPGEVRLSDGKDVFVSLPLAPGMDACCAVRELQKLPARGIRFRTRALTTTMFTRLCVADLFVHGIGGAKYDQMTDRIVARFLGMAAPDFLTLSATLELPAPGEVAHPEDERRLLRHLRELDYNSDRHLPVELPDPTRQLVAEKRRLVAEQNDVRRMRESKDQAPQFAFEGGYGRFRRLQEVNRILAGQALSERRRIEEELARTRQQLAASAILHDRDYAFCLYPAEKLQRFLDHVCAQAGG